MFTVFSDVVRFPLLETRLTVAAVAQVRPDDVLLRETEDSQPASSHRGVYDDARVHHQLWALEEPNSVVRRGNRKGQNVGVDGDHGSGCIVHLCAT